MSLEIHLGRTRNKRFPSLRSSPITHFVFCLRLLPSLIFCFMFWRIWPPAPRDVSFSIECFLCKWQWHLFLFPPFDIDNKFEMERDREWKRWGVRHFVKVWLLGQQTGFLAHRKSTFMYWRCSMAVSVARECADHRSAYRSTKACQSEKEAEGKLRKTYCPFVASGT